MADPVVRQFTDAEGLRWTARQFRPTLAIPLPETHAAGWVTFECEQTGARRRLVPAPADWATCDETALRIYHAAARRVPPRDRSGPLP